MVKLALVQRSLPLIQVLLVEDSPSDAFLVGSLLHTSSMAEYKTYHVSTQAEAIAAIAKRTFDVCLLDLSLPDANGFSALIDIQEKAPDMPVLILTGVNDTSMAKRAVGRGAQDYLLKDELEVFNLSRAIDYGMERKRLEKVLFQRANYDTLTGLANRDMFCSRLDMALARAQRSGLGVAVLYIDLDRFKPINDKHGHDAGDEILKTIARRIKAALRAYDTPARFGGDEFAVLLENISSARDAAHIAQKMLKTLTAPVDYHGHDLEVGASIGVVFSDASMPMDALLHQADTAMYHAKKEGGGCRFYSADMQDDTAARLGLEHDLRGGMEKRELRLYYQPYVTPDGDAVLGMEALLRWACPNRGLLCAHEFLPVAEEARLMPQIAQWMCTQVQRDLALWNQQKLPPMCLSLNLSATQLDAPELIAWLKPIAQKKVLGPHRLAVEIPEEVVVTLSPRHFLILEHIHALGIELHLDHFGRGAFSLSALHSLPFSLLKLDMSLIHGMSEAVSSDVLVRAAILLAHHLGMKAGAVGVEAAWQRDALRVKECDVIQGHLTMQPMTAEQLVAWMAEHPSKK